MAREKRRLCVCIVRISMTFMLVPGTDKLVPRKKLVEDTVDRLSRALIDQTPAVAVFRGPAVLRGSLQGPGTRACVSIIGLRLQG